MTDERRLELERFFDGELPPDRQAEAARLVAEDGDARLYVDRLARLRALARAHESAAAARPSRRRIPLVLAGAAAALAASVAALVVWWGRTASEASTAPGSAAVVVPALIAVPSGRFGPIREVELYTWANRNRRRPETAAGAVLLSRARPGRRPAALEVLALDLANASPTLADELEPLALIHKSPPGGRGRMERHARRPHPAVPGT
jgi:hypothetical protein